MNWNEYLHAVMHETDWTRDVLPLDIILTAALEVLERSNETETPIGKFIRRQRRPRIYRTPQGTYLRAGRPHLVHRPKRRANVKTPRPD